MSRLKIYSGPLSMFGAKVEIAVREKAVAFELVMVPFDFERGYAPKHPDVVRINPKQQVPVLVDDDVDLFDSTQIFEYLEDRWPDPPLWPRSVAARAQARQRELYSDEVFFPPVVRLMGLRGDPDPVDAPEWKAARAELQMHYVRMNELLEGREYITDRFSYADIAFYMAQFFAARHTVPMTSEHSNLLAWRERMIGRPAVRTVVAAMASYLRSHRRMVPELGGRSDQSEPGFEARPT